MIPTGRWPGFVARVATHAPPSVFADELASGWPAVVGDQIPSGVLWAMLAQIMLEIGARQVDRDGDGDVDADDQRDGCWNGNAGNIRGKYQGCWTSFRAGEGFGANEIFLEPGPDNKFRSYILPGEDPRDPEVRRQAIRRGVRDLIDLLRRKYPIALEAAARHDFKGYVYALADGGYFTANRAVYAKTEDALRKTVETLPQLAAFLREGRAA